MKLRTALLVVMACLLTGCTGGTYAPETPASKPREAEVPALGPPVRAVQADLPGDQEYSEAMALLGQLIAENPTAGSIVVTGSQQSGGKTYDLTWEYNREGGRFIYRQVDPQGATTEYRYSKVTDDVLLDLGKRAAEEFVDFSHVHSYGCPYELLSNAKVVLSEP